LRQQELQARQRELERRREALEAQIAALRAEFQAQEAELCRTITQYQARETQIAEDRLAMGHSRQSESDGDKRLASGKTQQEENL
jgi:circadian clock protein KaiC